MNHDQELSCPEGPRSRLRGGSTDCAVFWALAQTQEGRQTLGSAPSGSGICRPPFHILHPYHAQGLGKGPDRGPTKDSVKVAAYVMPHDGSHLDSPDSSAVLLQSKHLTSPCTFQLVQLGCPAHNKNLSDILGNICSYIQGRGSVVDLQKAMLIVKESTKQFWRSRSQAKK